jgi:hypothetical protein
LVCWIIFADRALSHHPVLITCSDAPDQAKGSKSPTAIMIHESQIKTTIYLNDLSRHDRRTDDVRAAAHPP